MFKARVRANYIGLLTRVVASSLIKEKRGEKHVKYKRFGSKMKKDNTGGYTS